jgi:Fur family transcriptional regulator, ferric uptake regulator
MAPQALHKQEKEQFIKLFRQDHIDRFEDRLTVLELFLQTEHHVTVSELAELLRQSGSNVSEEFIHDTIELMCRYGFAQHNLFDNGVMRYEHRHLGQHHDHMICTKCRKIIEFENQSVEQLQEQIASDYGFHMLQHRMELYGICRECQAVRDLVISLDAAKNGERLIIRGFFGGAKARLRLLTMGLRIGDCIEVINNVQQGQLVIAVDFKRLVLGRGLAEKIQVTPLRGSAKTAAIRQQGSA